MTYAIVAIFVVGYLAIALEHPLRVNKAASALLTGVLTWSVFALSSEHGVMEHLAEHVGEVSGILFFLIGAMTIVELIDAHDGFQVIVDIIRTRSKKRLIALISVITFFLSAVIDNLTTTIVLVSLLRKIVADREERLLIVGLVVIVANAGGAWSPIGDVTTTMLWISGEISAGHIIASTFVPSVVCAVIPAVAVAMSMKGELVPPEQQASENYTTSAFERNIVFALGIASLLFVPIFKTVTHLPPFMGMLCGLGLLWVVTEFIHADKDEAEKGVLSVNHALRKIDTPSMLFFLGILLAVACLQSIGVLHSAAMWLDQTVGNIDVINLIIGLLSSIVDNVPLVAGAQGMYDIQRFPADHTFWIFLAYCAGTGGSTLIIGSAAGVAAMGLEHIEFFWYVRRVSWLALIGYFGGAAVFLAERALFMGG
ncbi:MAG: sodium:proton antiporter NhaD [Myxococcales bacterium]|nr:sodium:proton antiporter NhaD [Myxococcales bacterium]